MSTALRDAAKRLESWIRDQALPLWSEQGINPVNKANYERFTATGAVDYESTTRARVQARQAFFFTVAADRGWSQKAAGIAKDLLAFTQQNAKHPSGKGYIHMFDSAYQVIDRKQDLYDHAFFVLANAWAYRAFGDQVYLDEVEALIAHLDDKFLSVYGGWTEGDYEYACRRQNPHMHLFEAILALYDATGDAKWLARAAEIFGLFQAHFFDAQKGVLFEFFQEDWTRLPDTKGETVEPGHMMEWVWLLDWYGKRVGRDVSAYTKALYANALARGMAPSGLLYDAIYSDGRIMDHNKRCWGITELIKASLVQIREGNPVAEAVAVKAVDDLFTYYLCASTPGSYVDQRGANDEVTVDVAPASTLYHLIVAATELLDHLAWEEAQ